MAPMKLKTRKYYELQAVLNEKRRRQAEEHVKLVNSLPPQLLPKKEDDTNTALPFNIPTEEQLARKQQERAEMMSPLEALQKLEDESSEGSWEPFMPRSKL